MAKQQFVIIIDPGYGIDTPGKRSPKWHDGRQLFEWDFNRKVSSFLTKKLRDAGITVEITVPGDQDKTIEERQDIINAIPDKYPNAICFMFSIHGHGYVGNNRNSIDIWVNRFSAQSNIGEILAKHFIELGWSSHGKDIKIKETPDEKNRFSFLQGLKIPSILSEIGYYTEYDECKRMLDPFWQEQIADKHFNAIMEYISTKPVTTTKKIQNDE